jgi:hypothetical protein
MIGPAALFTTVAGLIVLYLGIADAVQVVSFGDPNEDFERGETLMWVATGILAVGAVAVSAIGRHVIGALLAAPGLLALATLYLFPDSARPLVAFIALAPVALVASIVGAAGSRP